MRGERVEASYLNLVPQYEELPYRVIDPRRNGLVACRERRLSDKEPGAVLFQTEQMRLRFEATREARKLY